MRDMFIGAVLLTTFVIVTGWVGIQAIRDPDTTRTRAAFCGGVLAVLATTMAAVIWMLPN